MGQSKPVEFLPGRAGERALVARLMAGDQLAYRELYDTHAARLLRLLVRMLSGNQARAEEILQESFIAAFQAIGSYRQEASLTSWLTRIVVRRGLNAIRDDGRRATTIPGFEPEPAAQPSLDSKEAARRVLELINGLDEPKRLTMLLVAEGLSAREISEITGDARSTVAVRICRTRAQLAERAAQEGFFDSETEEKRGEHDVRRRP